MNFNKINLLNVKKLEQTLEYLENNDKEIVYIELSDGQYVLKNRCDYIKYLKKEINKRKQDHIKNM